MYKKLVRLSAVLSITILFILTGLLLILPAPVHAFEIEIREMSITVLDDTPIFSESNMAPGDNAASAATVSNTGEDAFDLSLSVELAAGDELLYELLVIEIGDGDSSYYRGPLHRLDGAPLGEIAGGEVRELDMAVSLPASAGNEYQGKEIKVSFIFTGHGESMPVTGTNINWLLIPGLLLAAIGGFLVLKRP
ncbi:MAG: hypothetical protein FH749_14390 [Firmicutes bacterium]|nr:hypothetical protein [Bacillota bacterium]